MDTTRRNRQPAGVSLGGAFAAEVHTAGTPELGAPRQPEKLSMGYVPDPDLQKNLSDLVLRGSASSTPAVEIDRFTAMLPNLETEKAEYYFLAAMDTHDDGYEYSRYMSDAVEANRAGHRGGALEPGYQPPMTLSRKGNAKDSTRQSGSKHTGYRDATEICRDIRTDLGAAEKGNYLPEGLKYSVTNEKYSGGQSIDVNIRGLSDADVLVDDADQRAGLDRYRPEARELIKRVQAVTDEYNRQEFDRGTDYQQVTYYSSVRIESDAARMAREAEAAKRRQARAGR